MFGKRRTIGNVRDKARPLQDDSRAIALLNWTIDEVIGHRRARAFLLRTDRKDAIIEKLFDARLIHLLKRSVATKDEPGVRYAVFKLDYGCYVDLINTKKGPDGLLPMDEVGAGDVDVPPDDYRSIRRAILDLEQFYNSFATEELGRRHNDVP